MFPIVDDNNGLYHARARYFNPQIGRLLTKDPITGKDSNSQSLNQYVYALNNPLRFEDLTGLSPLEQSRLLQSILGPTDLRFHILLMNGTSVTIGYANSGTPAVLIGPKSLSENAMIGREYPSPPARNKFRKLVRYSLDMSGWGVWPHYRRSRCWGDENRYLYLRLGSDRHPMGIPSTYAAQAS